MKKTRKRIFVTVLVAALLFNTLPSGWLTVAASEGNGTGLCEHYRSHTEECGYAEGADLSVCEGKETDEENTEIIETEDVETEDTSLCAHYKEHTEDCGYVPVSEDGEGSPCAYECRICPIEELIAALPDKVTEDNAKEVRAQLDKILALYGKLTEEEQEQTDLTRCLELQEALDAANVPVTVDVAAGDVVIDSNRQKITFTAELCGDSCPGHVITQGTSADAGDTADIIVVSGTHNITFSGLNLKKDADVGVLSGATMNLTIEGTNIIKGLECGIYVPVGATLVITAQSTGSLDISAGSIGAGIGGAYYTYDNKEGDLSCGTVEINGGTISAAGAGGGAGIGGAASDASKAPGNGGTVTINGGIVTARGSSQSSGKYGGAGIGGGCFDAETKSGCGGTLTINGGHATMTAGNHDSQRSAAYGFGKGSGLNPDGPCELILADAGCLADSTTLDPNGTYRFTGNPTADMITVPSDMHYTSADMAAEIAQKVTFSGKEICGQTFEIDMEGWSLSVTKKSDLEYTAVYTHTEKGTVSKPVIILPCLHGGGAALTHHERVEADCTYTGILEYWDCSVCGKKFLDEDGQTEITDTEIPIADHTLTHHEKMEADCTHTGVVEYWECSVCGKKFSDKDGQTEITDTEMPIAAHTLTHYEGKDADCTQAGNVEYWGCSVCGKKFSDNGGQTEISDTDVEIEVKPHTLAHHARVEAGCLTEGNIEYWSCGVCDKLFSDKDGTKEVTDIKIPAAGHNYSGWQSNGNGTHTRTCQTQDCGFAETGDCSGGTASYTDKAVCTVCKHEYGELLKDSDAPTGEISIHTSKWNSFLNTITFSLFFKNTEKVIITAEDQESGVKSVSYYIADRGMSEEEVKALTTEWTDVDGDTAAFHISEDKSCVVYAKITDKQGNVAYISSDGMIFDGTVPSIAGVENGKAYCGQQAVTVTDNNLESVTVNGKEVTLTDDKFILDAESGVQMIEAKDKAGNTVKATVNMGHRYGTEWKTDETQHWHECSSCDKKPDTAAHTQDNGTVTKAPTETETGIKTYYCNVCGYKMKEEVVGTLPPDHTHEFGGDWKKDAGSHWHECICGERSDAAVHTKDNGTVTKEPTETVTGILTYSCSVCGYKMDEEVLDPLLPGHTHEFGTGWETDSRNHWRECICGGRSDAGVHTKDNGIVTKKPTETETGIRTYSCSACGYGMGWEVIDKLPHEFGSEWKTDGGSHWHECACGEKSDLAAHTEDAGSVTKPATAAEAGIRTYKCSVCGYVMRMEEIAKLPQNPDSGGSGSTGSSGGSGGNTGSPGGSSSSGSTGSPGGSNSGGTKQPSLKDSSGREGWDVIRAEAEKAAAAPEGGTVAVDMNGTVTVPGSIFEKIRDKDVTAAFDMGDGFVWSVNGKDVTAENISDTDLSVKAGTGYIPKDVAMGASGGLTYLELRLAHDGPFGFAALLSIRITEKAGSIAAGGSGGVPAGYTGMYANLFYYNPVLRSLEFVSAAKIAGDGTVRLPFVHASDYAVILSAEPMGTIREPSDAGQENPAGGTGQQPGTDPAGDTGRKPQVKSVKLSKTVYTYSGKAKKPSVTVTGTDGKRIPAKYYTVSYKNNKLVGKAVVTVRLKGIYSGTVKKTFTIRPAGTSIRKLKAVSGGFTVKWKTRTAQTDGYQVQYSIDAGFKGSGTHSVFVKNASGKRRFKKLKAGKNYYVRVRTYKAVKAGGKIIRFYSAWSSAGRVKTPVTVSKNRTAPFRTGQHS